MMRSKYFTLGILALVVIAVIFISGCVQQEKNPTIVSNTTRTGTITDNEIWSGEILVTESVTVPREVTLTLEPGTVVKMKHNRDYKNPDKTIFEVHGTLKAIGTPEKQIQFTSDAPEPQNGDWAMLRLFGKTKSEIKYAIVEFAQQGINMWDSDAVISHSIIRWNNWEGLYAESYSEPVIEYNRIYQNGYNGMAMEQFNKAVLKNNLFESSGTHGLHIDVSEATAENNIFRNNGASGLSLDDASTVTEKDNIFENNKDGAVACGEGKNMLNGVPCGEISGKYSNTDTGAIDFGYPDTKKYDLGYTPGDIKKDKYRYVYPDDETRKVVKKIGKGLGLAWSLALEGKDIWTSTVGGDVYKLSGETGEILKQFKVNSPQPWGMAFDGTNLWITDFAEKRTYSIDTNTGGEIFSFKNPDQKRGAKGLAFDGKNLYIMGWTTSLIYKMDTKGNLLETIRLKDIEAGGGLAFDGKNFWIPCGNRICKFSENGKLIGAIYSASEGTWDLAWEPAENKAGGYLWASQRTNENWQDEKIYKIEILDDSIN